MTVGQQGQCKQTNKAATCQRRGNIVAKSFKGNTFTM